jgi:hypothetical protein
MHGHAVLFCVDDNFVIRIANLSQKVPNGRTLLESPADGPLQNLLMFQRNLVQNKNCCLHYLDGYIE